MTQAIFGLVGVMVGGLITAGVQIGIRRAEQRRLQRVGARGLLFDLVRAEAAVGCAAGDGSLAHFETFPDLLRSWEMHGGALGSVDYETWATVSSTVITTASVIHLEGIESRTWKEDTHRDVLEGRTADLGRAIAALKRHAIVR